MIKHDPTIREDWIWEDFSEKGLCPEIRNIEDYRAQLTKNYVELERKLAGCKTLLLSPEDVKEMHGILFKDIYPWAGQFRSHNIMCRGRGGAAPENIETELRVLQTQTEIMLREAKTHRALLRIAAFQHARLTTIQAFGDGNTRTSRAITEHFLTAIFQKPRQAEIDRKYYFKCLEAALGQENLAPLAAIFQEIYGETPEKCKWAPAPFRTTNLPYECDPLRALPDTFRQVPSILDEKTPEKVRFLNHWDWEQLKSTVGGKPTGQETRCRQIWEEARKEPMTWRALTETVTRIQKLQPLTKPLFGKKPDWGRLLDEIKPPEFDPQTPLDIQPRLY